MFDFGLIRKSIADVGAEVARLRSERETLLRRREDLESAPACKEDMVALLDAWVDRQGATFPKKLEVGVSYYRRHALDALPEDPKAPTHPMAVLTAVLDPNATATIGSLEASLFFVLRDLFKKAAREAVENWDFTDAGPPRTERLELIEAIDKRIAELDKQEMSLVEEAEQSGLRL